MMIIRPSLVGRCTSIMRISLNGSKMDRGVRPGALFLAICFRVTFRQYARKQTKICASDSRIELMVNRSEMQIVFSSSLKPCQQRLAHSCILSLFRLGRSMALRSEQVVLSCPSSLQGHSDFPSARNACLAGFIQLGLRLSPSDHGERPEDLRSDLRSLSPHAVDLTPGPPPVHLPFSSRRALAFPPNVRGRRVAPSLTEFIPQSGSPSYIRPI